MNRAEDHNRNTPLAAQMTWLMADSKTSRDQTRGLRRPSIRVRRRPIAPVERIAGYVL